MAKATTNRKEEMYQFIEAQKLSGYSQLNFCKAKAMSIATYSYWLRKYKLEKTSLSQETKSQKPPSQFIPIQLDENSKSSVNNERIEINYPNGVKISCSAEIDMQKLQELIFLV